MTKTELINLLEGGDITITIEGGNDSGSIEVMSYTLNYNQISNIENYFYTLCDYGSFAGSFSVYGSSYYDKKNEELVLIAEDIDEESYENERSYPLNIEIPEIIKQEVDSVSIYYSMSDVNIRLNINNGMWKEAFDEYEDIFEDRVKEILNNSKSENAYFDEVVNIDELENFEVSTYDYFTEEVTWSISVDALLILINEIDE